MIRSCIRNCRLIGDNVSFEEEMKQQGCLGFQSEVGILFQDFFLAPNGRRGDEERKKILWSMSLGVSERCIVFRAVLPQETPIWIARWMPQNLFWGG